MNETTIDVEPWARLPHETSPAYSAFMVFLDLGLTRSLAGAYRLSQGEKQGKTGGSGKTHRQAASHWEQWHSQNCWQERAEAHDRHQRLLTDQEARKELKAKLLDYADRMENQGKVFEQFIRGAQNVLLPQLIRLTNEPQDMSARDMMYSLGKMAQLVEIWQGTEAIALGIPRLVELFDEKEG